MSADAYKAPELDDEQACDLARALCLLAARSESSHPEGQLAPGEPTAILIFWRLLATWATELGLFEPSCALRNRRSEVRILSGALSGALICLGFG